MIGRARSSSRCCRLGGRERPAAVCGLRSLHIGVVDLDRALDFFTRVWGLATVAKGNGPAYLRASGPDHHVVALHNRPETEILRVAAVTILAASGIGMTMAFSKLEARLVPWTKD